MIVRVAVYGTESVDASVEWGRECAEDLRALPGVERFDFVSQQDPPRAGAVFEIEERISEHEGNASPECPECGSRETRQMFSEFFPDTCDKT